MAIIDQIMNMKQQGMQDEQIIRDLKEQGVSPRQIDEALDQSMVKAAVSDEQRFQEYPSPEQDPGQMQPSMMLTPDQQEQIMPTDSFMSGQQPAMRRQTQEMQENPYPAPQEQYAEYSPEQGQYPQEQGQYPQYEYYQQGYPQQGADTETITDIAQQAVDEKLEKANKQLQSLSAFKIEIQGRVADIDERLKRIEMTIDRLQTSILGKIGEYWKNISDIKDEMHATQESFSKVLSPYAENMQKLKRISGESTGSSGATKTEKKRGKPRPGSARGRGGGFEHYLRR